ncbi:endonuclease domain-containing 1 protein-like [Paramisgurnus dabryanus]|uniref:endonuclease domain-containing 1 protein-like n=1 Tax=Paramisgurnus dabryanus TaxID=90735 RepID=UPI0031F3A3BA
MRLFLASIVFVLPALSFPGIVGKLEENITTCGDFFFDEKPPVIPGILMNSVALNDTYKIICQKYENEIRFATLYDTREKIPVFSAYKYIGANNFERPQIPWMIESELEPSGDEMCKPFTKQARINYWINKTEQAYIPGTLFPMNHTADRETAESTLTLTNSVPLKLRFREGLWSLVEQEIKENMDRNCRDENNNIVAYVLTGAVPGGENLKVVKIPSHMWTAFCCYNSSETVWVSQTYWAENTHNNDLINIRLHSLEDLQNFLNEQLGRNIKLFNNNCGKKSNKLPPSFRSVQIRADG